MIKTLSKELAAEGFLKTDDHVVVGVSGGSDSMALLHVLVALNRDHDWRLNLHVAHLNHGLRDFESEKDAAFVQGAADGLGLPVSGIGLAGSGVAALSIRLSEYGEPVTIEAPIVP